MELHNSRDHDGRRRRHDEQTFAQLKIKQQPPQTMSCFLESDSEKIDDQLAGSGCWPCPRGRRPARSPQRSSEDFSLSMEGDGEAETQRRWMNDEKHHGQRKSSTRRMKARELRHTTAAYPPKLPALRYEESGSESETNLVRGSSPEPVSESIFEDRELRRQAAAAGPDSDSGAEWVREIPSTRRDEEPKGCSSSRHMEIRGSFLTHGEVDSAILELLSTMTEEILGFGREVRMQIIQSESRHRRSTRRACKFHYFFMQGRVANLLRVRSDVLLDRLSEKVQDQVRYLENHFLEKLTEASTTLRQSIESHNFSSSSSASSTQLADHQRKMSLRKML